LLLLPSPFIHSFIHSKEKERKEKKKKRKKEGEREEDGEGEKMKKKKEGEREEGGEGEKTKMKRRKSAAAAVGGSGSTSSIKLAHHDRMANQLFDAACALKDACEERREGGEGGGREESGVD
jgi:hypothetical protein